MISDDLLKQALSDYEENRFAQLPAEPHEFSPQFEKQIAGLAAKKPVRCFAGRPRAAGFAAAVLTASLLAFCISPTARATVISWIRGQENTYFTYRSTGSDQTDDTLVYSLGYVPEGYSLFGDFSEPGHGMVVYANEAGALLSFQYSADTGNSAMYLDPESAEHITAEVGASIADVYVSQAADESSAIVWMDSQTNYLLSVTGFFDQEALIRLAEAVAIVP